MQEINGGTLNSVSDRTERPSSQAAEPGNLLKRDEIKFRKIFESGMFGMLLWDQQGQILDANDAFLSMLGYSRADLSTGKINWKALTPSEYLHLNEKALRELESQTAFVPFEKEYVRKDGSRVPVMIGGANLPEVSGKGGVAFVLDMTVQKRTQKDLSDLKFALDQSSIVATTDRHGIITYVNDNFCRISKYSREELLGQSHSIVNSGYHPKKFFRDLWQTILEGKIWRGEILNRAKDETFYWVDTVIVPFLGEDGQPYQFTAIRTDITERKKSEDERAQMQAREHAALEASRLKSEFLANMSHEIRTPLNSIVGMADLLMDSSLTIEQKDYASAIRDSAKVLVGLISDILDFSKIEAGKLRVDQVGFDFRELILDAERSFRWFAERKGICLKVHGPDPVPPFLVGDPGKIRQVLANLLSNGIKFTESGSVTLRAQVEQDTGAAIRVRVEVEDTGIGMDMGTLARLFDPFVQSDSSVTRKYGGTGLGLSISKKLVSLMGGELGVSSEVGKGSKFWFSLSLEKAVLPGRREEVRTRLSLFQGDARILLVEDISANRKVMTLLLRKLGLSPDIAANGIEAIEALERKQYDLVLMDCHMPEMDGYTATKIIRSREGAAYREVPIVALTASAMAGDREKCLAVGMSDYLAKPIGIQQFSDCLEKWLKTVSRSQIPPEIPSIRWDIFERLQGFDENGTELITEIVELLSKSVPLRIEAIETAIERRDGDVILREAHGLKSSTSYVGALKLANLCDQVEELARSGRFENITPVCAAIEKEFWHVLDLLK